MVRRLLDWRNLFGYKWSQDSTAFVDSELSAALFGQTRRAVLAPLYGHRRQGAATPSFSYFIRADAKLERCGIAGDKEPAAGGC